MTFGTEKLEWLGYPKVKKIFEDMFIRFDHSCKNIDVRIKNLKTCFISDNKKHEENICKKHFPYST